MFLYDNFGIKKLSEIGQGTPYYLFSHEVLLANWTRLLKSITKYRTNLIIAYSYKTNPLLGICSYLKDLGAWAEVTSLFEYEVAEAVGVKSDQIIFNGPYKTEEELIQCIKKGTIVNVDGWKQLDDVTRISQFLGMEARIGVRITPSGITDWDRFGIDLLNDRTQFSNMIEYLGQNPLLKLCCLHCHIGTNIIEVNKFFESASLLGRLWQRFFDEGYYVDYLDIGGGYRSLESEIVQIAYLISSGLAYCGVPSDVTLIIEPGRALVETSGIVVASVIEIRQKPGTNVEYLVLDVGVNTVMGVDYVGSRDVISLSVGKETNRLYDIVGPLCIQRDILAENVLLPQQKPGDMLLITNTGAYDFSTSYPFIRLRPSAYVFEHGNFRCLRREETFTDILAREFNIK